MTNLKYIAILIFALVLPMGIGSAQPNPEVSQDVRNVAAQKILEGRSGVVAVYARGLCCPSCAIGVRRMVSALDFVDTEKPEKGVVIDPVNQLVTVEVKTGKTVDSKAIRKAIQDAGYAPVHIYTVVAKKLVTQSIE